MSDQLAGSPLEKSDTATALLRHFDWAPTSKVPGKYEVWTLDGSYDEILVPLDPAKGDFDPLLDRAWRTLLSKYGHDAARVRDLLTLRLSANLASTQWKKQTAVNAGLITWVEGESLFNAAQDSLTASAKATHEKRMHHGTASAYIARKFLEKTLMGQTEIGSFIVTAHTPSTERFHVSQRSENRAAKDYRQAEMVSGGEILATLKRSLEAVRAGLDEYRHSPNIEGFVPLIEDGVSFELVRSLTALTQGGDAAVSIETDTGNGDGRTEHAEITFDSVESAVLSKVAEKFSEAKAPETVHLLGEVSRLDNSSTSPVHLIGLDIKSGSDVRRARVRLTPEQYELAVEAHAAHNWLEVSGQLQRDGRDYWLYNAARVRLAPAQLGPDSYQVSLLIDGDAGEARAARDLSLSLDTLRLPPRQQEADAVDTTPRPPIATVTDEGAPRALTAGSGAQEESATASSEESPNGEVGSDDVR
jgi:hypothetical protein